MKNTSKLKMILNLILMTKATTNKVFSHAPQEGCGQHVVIVFIEFRVSKIYFIATVPKEQERSIFSPKKCLLTG